MTDSRAPGWYPTEDGVTRFWDGQVWSDRPFPGAQPAAAAPVPAVVAPTAPTAPAATRSSFWRALHTSGMDRYLIALGVIVVIGIVWAVVANHHDAASSAAGTRVGKTYGQVYRAASGSNPGGSQLALQCDLAANTAEEFGDSSGLAPHAVKRDDFVSACIAAAQSG